MSLSDRVRAGSEAAPWVVDAIKALEAENAELRRDAERYRWLRDTGDGTWVPMAKRVPEGARGIDAAIDSAMKESGNG